MDKAEKGFGELADNLSSSDSLQFLAVERAAYLQEARGDIDAALRTWSKVVNVDGGFYKDYALFHQARLYLHLNDQSRARKLLERIEEKYPTSPVIEKVHERLALLGPAQAGRSLESKGETGGAENDEEVSTEAGGEAAAGETAGTVEKMNNTKVASGAAVGSVAKAVDQEPASDAAEESGDEASP
jgi:tetratricopeptide (TPR) repeat protein